MTRSTSVFVALFIFSVTVFGQKKIPGQIVYKNTTINVTFLIPSVLGGYPIEALETKAHYIDENGNARMVRPKNAEEIRFKLDEQDVRMISRRPKHEASRKKFLRLLVDGRVQFYEYIKTYRLASRSRREVQTVIYWYLQRDGGEMIMARQIGFREKMLKVFNDCPALIERINAKIYKPIDAYTMAKFYKVNCE